MPVERTAEIAASPETIWTYLGQLERWPEWDADIKSISDVQGGLVEGGSFMLHMEGVSVPITIKDLKEQQGFRWVGLAMCGCLTCEGVQLRTGQLFGLRAEHSEAKGDRHGHRGGTCQHQKVHGGN
ncbi:unnamed protein product [Durusdinium trenchii]|uniref:Polyketide cyclase/dehydrase n=1 Tax=Durusdinium trenchii TaxID=1381693 RepID=A0ABP0P708_9DINO